MTSLIRLFYVSHVVQPLAPRALTSILQASRRNNEKVDVTGCLLYSPRYFAQVLEGDAEVVRALSARIAVDARHDAIRIVAESEAPTRLYERWSMGYVFALELEDELEKLYSAAPGAEGAWQLIHRIKPDSMMGELR